MDVIAALGFGMDIDSQTNPDNTFVKYAKELFPSNVTLLLILIGEYNRYFQNEIGHYKLTGRLVLKVFQQFRSKISFNRLYTCYGRFQ
jgi:hypothetical protein